MMEWIYRHIVYTSPIILLNVNLRYLNCTLFTSCRNQSINGSMKKKMHCAQQHMKQNRVDSTHKRIVVCSLQCENGFPLEFINVHLDRVIGILQFKLLLVNPFEVMFETMLVLRSIIAQPALVLRRYSALEALVSSQSIFGFVWPAAFGAFVAVDTIWTYQ